MGLSVVTNTAAMNAHRNLSLTSTGVGRSFERLSSGYRINRAADDAAGLAISEGLRSQVGGYAQAMRNTRDGVSVVQTAEGALSETTSVLQRMRDLAVQAANAGGLSTDALTGIQTELTQLTRELTRIADTTTFNGTALLDGTYHGTFQVGPHTGDTISLPIRGALDAAGLGLDGVNLAATSDPASVNAFPAQGRIERIQTGALVFLGATATPGAIEALRGTITFDGHTLDLGITYTDTDNDGAIDNAERVDQLNAAASGAGMTHRTDPFVDDGDDLIFRGRAPLPDATDTELAALSPDYSDPSPQVLEVPASTSIPPQPGGLMFPGTLAADLPTLRGSVSADGETLELGSVTYTDTDSDGTISGAEALAQLNAAAKAAGITTHDHAFVESRLITLSDDEFVDHGLSLQFRGSVPADDATPEELLRASPVFTPGQDLITRIDAAIRTVSTQRAELGAIQNRFEHTLANLGVAHENAVAALSRIRDADVAAETTVLARNQILLQAGTAMLSQANQSAQQVLKLLQA
ncbi:MULTISPECIES: flagellin N-terminal helical domain-containing protein [unclassified Modestobacter]